MYNLLSLLFYVAGCGDECPEVATQDYSDVEDIPIPSQNREEEEESEPPTPRSNLRNMYQQVRLQQLDAKRNRYRVFFD